MKCKVCQEKLPYYYLFDKKVCIYCEIQLDIQVSEFRRKKSRLSVQKYLEDRRK